MTRPPKNPPTAVTVRSLRAQVGRHDGQLSALIEQMVEVRSRLDKLEVVRVPSVTTEEPDPPPPVEPDPASQEQQPETE